MLKNMQKEVDDWAQQYEVPSWDTQKIIARLFEENGELAREINHLYGPKKKKLTEDKKDLGEEVVDVIFTLCCLANSQNINLDEPWRKLFDNKLYG